MIRIILLRLFISWWAIPLAYIVFLPLFYLLMGNFKEELGHVNAFAKHLWTGKD